MKTLTKQEFRKKLQRKVIVGRILILIILVDFLCYLPFKATVNSTQAPPWSGLSRVR